MFKKNCKIRNNLTNTLVKAYNFLPNVLKEGEGGKGVLNSVKKLQDWYSKAQTPEYHLYWSNFYLFLFLLLCSPCCKILP